MFEVRKATTDGCALQLLGDAINQFPNNLCNNKVELIKIVLNDPGIQTDEKVALIKAIKE